MFTLGKKKLRILSHS